MLKGTCKNGKDVRMKKFTEIQIISILMINGSGILSDMINILLVGRIRCIQLSFLSEAITLYSETVHCAAYASLPRMLKSYLL